MRIGSLAIAVVALLAAPYAASQSVPTKSAKALQKSTQVEQPIDPATVDPVDDGRALPSVTVIDAGEARGILGREVRSAADENMGRIVDVIVDQAGLVRAAVIDFGGFLGVGSRKIVVDWGALRFSRVASRGGSITLELTRDQVRAAPEYKEGKPIVVLGAAGKLEPLRFLPPTTSER